MGHLQSGDTPFLQNAAGLGSVCRDAPLFKACGWLDFSGGGLANDPQPVQQLFWCYFKGVTDAKQGR
jgi:hypothetical protein